MFLFENSKSAVERSPETQFTEKEMQVQIYLTDFFFLHKVFGALTELCCQHFLRGA